MIYPPTTWLNRSCPCRIRLGRLIETLVGQGIHRQDMGKCQIAGCLIDVLDQHLKMKLSVASPLIERRGVHRQ